MRGRGLGSALTFLSHNSLPRLYTQCTARRTSNKSLQGCLPAHRQATVTTVCCQANAQVGRKWQQARPGMAPGLRQLRVPGGCAYFSTLHLPALTHAHPHHTSRPALQCMLLA